MRIALLDPPSFTVPYDHALASALARPRARGDAADRAVHARRRAEPEGYRREEIFLPVSSRLVRRSALPRPAAC